MRVSRMDFRRNRQVSEHPPERQGGQGRGSNRRMCQGLPYTGATPKIAIAGWACKYFLDHKVAAVGGLCLTHCDFLPYADGADWTMLGPS